MPRTPQTDKKEIVPGSPDIFSRLPGESSEAFTAFSIYRDLGPMRRSLAETTRLLIEQRKEQPTSRLIFIDQKTARPPQDGSHRAIKRRHGGQISAWSSKWKWVERAQAWDDYLDKARQNAYRDQVAKMAEEHSRLLSGSRKVLGVVLNSFAQAMKDEQRADTWKRLSAVDLFEMSIEAMKVMPKILEAERAATGVTVVDPEDGSPQGGDIEWIVETYQPPREGEVDLSRFDQTEQKVHWEGDQPQPDEDDPAEGQAFPPSGHRT